MKDGWGADAGDVVQANLSIIKDCVEIAVLIATDSSKWFQPAQTCNLNTIS
jgi:hypothetical protein